MGAILNVYVGKVVEMQPFLMLPPNATSHNKSRKSGSGSLPPFFIRSYTGSTFCLRDFRRINGSHLTQVVPSIANYEHMFVMFRCVRSIGFEMKQIKYVHIDIAQNN